MNPTINDAPIQPSAARHWRTGGTAAAAVSALLGIATLITWIGYAEYDDIQYYDTRIDYSWNQVINQYVRRMELVPNLVAVLEPRASHETDLFNRIAASRAGLARLSAAARDSRDPQVLEQFRVAQARLSAELPLLLAVAEKYPDVQSTTRYRDLMVQLKGTESRLGYARQRYFASVDDYNLGIERFPASLVASRTGFGRRAAVAIADEGALRPVPEASPK